MSAPEGKGGAPATAAVGSASTGVAERATVVVSTPPAANGFSGAGKSIDWAEPSSAKASPVKSNGAGSQGQKGGLDPEWWGGGSAMSFPGAGDSGGPKAPAAPPSGGLGQGWQSPSEATTVASAPAGTSSGTWGGGWGSTGGPAPGGPGGSATSSGSLGSGGLGSSGGLGGGLGGGSLGASGGLGGGGLGGSTGHGGGGLGGSGGGWGAATASGSLGAGSGGGPGAAGGGLGGGWSAPSSIPPTQTGPAGGGWLGGGSATVPTENSADANWAGAPSASAASAASLPPLELPDHTVPVDLGTPWEEPDSGKTSSKITKVLMGGLVTTVVVFLGYVGVTRMTVARQPEVTPTVSGPVTSWPVGDEFVKNAQKNIKANNYSAAARDANDAYRFFQATSGVPATKLKEVSSLRNKANLGWADQLLAEAVKAKKAEDWNVAIPRAKKAEELYKDFGGSADKSKLAKSIVAAANAHLVQAKAAGEPDPTPVRPNTPAEPESAPSIGDGPSTPQGKRSGGYRAPASQPKVETVAAPPPKPRPQAPAYVPPRQQESNTRLGRQGVLPTY